MLIGHGIEQETFEKRDLVTTAKLSFEERKTANEITTPIGFRTDNTVVQKMQINQQKDSVPCFMGAELKKE